MRLAISLLVLGCAGWSLSTEPVQAPTAIVTGTVSVARKPGTRGDSADAAISLKPLAGPVTGGATDERRPRPKMLQRNKQFSPRVLVVPAGTVVDFPNLDPFFHNAFSLFEGNRFDLGLYERGTTKSVTFSKPGICYIFCNIHPEMSAVVVVVDTPYYAVSNPAGEFTIAHMPPGRYALSVWHARNKPANPREFPREVTISAGTSDLGPIRLVESDQVMAPHMNKYGHEYIPAPAPGTGYIIIR